MKQSLALSLAVLYDLPSNLCGFSSMYAFRARNSITILHSESIDVSTPYNDSDEKLPSNVSVIKVDDHGSDLTDRFKYKVNALMGTFDPPNSEIDDENQNGNILSAMLFFPTQYTFNVVGKTSGSDDEVSSFIDKVNNIVSSGSGDPKDEMKCETKARGKNYTKVSITAMVDSADIINNIYEELSSISVMRF